MRPTSVTVSSLAASAPIPVDWRAGSFNLGLFVDVTGTNTSSVEYTLDDIFNPAVTPVWLAHATLTGLIADAAGVLTTPVQAVRLNVTAYTNGSARLQVVSASGRGN